MGDSTALQDRSIEPLVLSDKLASSNMDCLYVLTVDVATLGFGDA